MQRLRGVALGATVVWPVVAAGGFSAHAQFVFIVLAAGLLTVLLSSSDAGLQREFRGPLPLVLLMTALVSVVSAAWTLGSSGAALRTGLLAAAYGVVLVASLLAARDGGGAVIAAAIATAAAVEALVGVVAVSTHSLPEAERLAGVWRPGGTFEYQPALALLQVGALPVLCSYLEEGRVGFRATGAVGAVLAGGTLVLAGDRLALALAALLLVILLFVRARAGGGLVPALALIASAAAGGGVAAGTLERTVSLGAPAPGVLAALPLLGVALLAGGLAMAAGTGRGSAMSRRLTAPGQLLRIASVAVLLAVILAVVVLIAGVSDGSSLHTAGLLHGRLEEWRAALQTWFQRPLLGWGAGSYYIASLPHQTVAISLFAHDLPLEWAAELGITGLALAVGLYLSVGRILADARLTAEWVLFAPLVVAFMVSNLVDWTWHIPGLTVLWVLAVGALSGTDAG